MINRCQHYLFPSFPLTQTIWTRIFLTCKIWTQSNMHTPQLVFVRNREYAKHSSDWASEEQYENFVVPHGFGVVCFFFVILGIQSSNLRLEMDCSTFLEFSKTWINVFKAYLPLSPCFNTEMWSAHPLLPLARLDVYKCTLKLSVLDLTFAHGCEGTTWLGGLFFFCFFKGKRSKRRLQLVFLWMPEKPPICHDFVCALGTEHSS